MAELELLVPEFEYRQKGPMWYLVALAVMAALGLLAWWVRNISFIGLIAMAFMVLVARQIKKPALVSLKLDANGISLGKKFWEYKNLRGFSISELEGKKYLIIISTGKFGVPTWIQVNDTEAITNKLINYLPQVEYEESFAESLARILRL